MVSEKAKAPQPATGRTVSFVRDAAYSEALGRFVEAFAGAETVLFNYLSASLRMPHSLAKAAFPGTRADQMIEIVRHVWQIEPPPESIMNEADDVLTQLKTINTARNRLIHHQSFMTSDKGRVSSNITRAYTKERIDEAPISIEAVNDMTSDLEKAGHHLATLLIRPYVPLKERELEVPALADAWRYKVQLFRNPKSQKPVPQHQKRRITHN